MAPKPDPVIDALIKPPRVRYARPTYATRVTGRALRPIGIADRAKFLALRLQPKGDR